MESFFRQPAGKMNVAPVKMRTEQGLVLTTVTQVGL